MNTKQEFPKPQRDTLKAFGDGLSRMALLETGNRNHGKLILKALDCLTYAEEKLKANEKKIEKAVGILVTVDSVGAALQSDSVVTNSTESELEKMENEDDSDS